MIVGDSVNPKDAEFIEIGRRKWEFGMRNSKKRRYFDLERLSDAILQIFNIQFRPVRVGISHLYLVSVGFLKTRWGLSPGYRFGFP